LGGKNLSVGMPEIPRDLYLNQAQENRRQRLRSIGADPSSKERKILILEPLKGLRTLQTFEAASWKKEKFARRQRKTFNLEEGSKRTRK